MNEDRTLALALRQQQLLGRSAELRSRVALEMVPWKHRLGKVDHVRTLASSSWQWLRSHPEVPAGLAIGLVVLRPKRAVRWVWRWGRRAWLGWQLYRRIGGGAPPQPGQSAASPTASLARMVVELTRR